MGFDRKAVADKILLLGVDGLDPRLTRKYVDQGKMPNVAEYIRRGAARHDLMLLGGHPTVTPPMWTTLATGCYANVHGITGFSRNIPGKISRVGYKKGRIGAVIDSIIEIFLTLPVLPFMIVIAAIIG